MKSAVDMDASPMPSPSDLKLRYWKWRILIATMACYLFYYCGRFNLAICLKPIMDEFGWDESIMGYLTSVLIITYGTSNIFSGGLGDRFGRILLLLGGVLSCLANWAFSYTPELAERFPAFGSTIATAFGLTGVSGATFVMMGLMWGVNGLVQSMGMAPGGRLIAAWWPRPERGFAMGLYTAAAALANVTVFLLATMAVHWWGWRAAFRYPVLLMGGMSILFYLVTKDRPEQVGLESPHEEEAAARATSGQDEGGAQKYLTALKNVGFVLTCISVALHHVMRWGLLSFVPLFFMQTYDWKIKSAGIVSAALPLGMALGAVSGGWISDRFFDGRRTRIISLSLGLCALAVAVFGVLTWFGVLGAGEGSLTTSFKVTSAALLVGLGYLLYLCIGPYLALPPDLLGTASAGTGIGVMNASAYAGAAIGTAACGVIIRDYGYAGCFAVMAVCGMIGAVIIRLVPEGKVGQGLP